MAIRLGDKATDFQAATTEGDINGPDKKIKLTLIYPDSASRNCDEILRASDTQPVTPVSTAATPANLKDGNYCSLTSASGGAPS